MSLLTNREMFLTAMFSGATLTLLEELKIINNHLSIQWILAVVVLNIALQILIRGGKTYLNRKNTLNIDSKEYLE